MRPYGLMIGDLVRLNKDVSIKSGTIVKVRSIDGERHFQELTGCATCVPIDDIDGMSYGVLLEYLEPIPLTPEILEKNGFENDFYEEESVADYHTIRLEGYSLKNNIDGIDEYLITWCNGSLNVTTDFHGCVQKEIAYVHDLQHALKLCDIEKEIIL